VFGVHAKGQAVAHLTYLGLYALQHRGQESAGIAVSDGHSLTVVKEMGLVANAFDDRSLEVLSGDLSIGHVRYSTTGASAWRGAQPVFRSVGEVEFALGHNGNLVNTAALAEDAGMLPGTMASDSDLVAELLCHEIKADNGSVEGALERALLAVLPRLQGAFSFVLMDHHQVIGVRDPNGFRPLCVGKLGDGRVLASESPALDVVGAEFMREIEPGEMVVLDGSEVRSVHPFSAEEVTPSQCIFEYVYFARPDTNLNGGVIHQARNRMGELLAEQAPVDADLVMGVPESGIPAATGFARYSGIPYGIGLIKNRYIGRTFIAPNQALRALGVRMKLNPLVHNIEGKRLVVVDDSIVRGTTTKAMIQMLLDAGAKEVHLRVSSPPYRWPCFYGMDTGDRSTLLAADRSVEEIREYLGVDTLAYLTLDRLIESTGAPDAGFCSACLDGNYPVPVAIGQSKAVLDETVEATPVSDQLVLAPGS